MIRLFVKSKELILMSEVASVTAGKHEWEDIDENNSVINDDPDNNVVWVQDFEADTIYAWNFVTTSWEEWKMDEAYAIKVEEVADSLDLLGRPE